MLRDKVWFTGGEESINVDQIRKITLEYISKGAKVYIGSDSFITQGKVCFASAICLHANNLGGRYFFFREKEIARFYVNLVSRITEETRRSVEIASVLMEDWGIHPKDIELHLDVSPFSANNGTSKFSEMLKGYVVGFGLDCKLKPNAWAGQTIADKHSK